MKSTRSKENISDALTITSIVVTLVGAVVSMTRKETAGIVFALSILIALLIWGIYRHLRSCGKILLGKEIRNLINTIDSVKHGHISADLHELWHKKYLQLCACLKHYVVLWDCNFAYKGLKGALCNESAAEWDCRSKSLRTVLQNLPFLIASKDLEDEVNEWATVGDGESRPEMGIDNRGEHVMSGYKMNIKRRLSDKIVTRIEKWLHANDKRNLDVLLVGANDCMLTKKILEDVRDYRKLGYMRVSMHGMTKANEDQIREYFSKDDKVGNKDKIRICDDIGVYDILIVTHYYQHHFEIEFTDTDFPLQCAKVRPNGLLVWVSAIARNNNVCDEYVCEGCTPMHPSIENKAGEGVAYSIVGECPPTRAIGYLSYSQMKEYVPHMRLLGLDFPRTFFVEKSIVNGTGIAKVAMEYLLMERQKDQNKVESGSISFSMRRVDGSWLNGSYPQIRDVVMRGMAKSVDEQNAIQEYYLISVIYSDSDDANYFIVTRGAESYEWNNGSCLDEDRLTIYPCFEYRIEDDNDGNLQLHDEILQYFKDPNDENKSMRYYDALAKIPCAVGEDVSVWRLHTRIKDVDLSDYMIFAKTLGEDKGIVLYFAALPKKRYLSQHEFNEILGRMECFKSYKKLAYNGTGFRPAFPRSVTWLYTFNHIIGNLLKCNFLVEKDDAYFHKCYGTIDENGLNKSIRLSRMLKKHPGITRELKDDCVSVDKDNAFNRLSLDNRLRLLGCMNVHDVLLFASKVG